MPFGLSRGIDGKLVGDSLPAKLPGSRGRFSASAYNDEVTARPRSACLDIVRAPCARRGCEPANRGAVSGMKTSCLPRHLSFVQ